MPIGPYWDRQPASGPKRMLALDGGGIRGVITLEILARMEELLGAGDPEFVLADYFDYIAGTSTGAIIAAALSLGRRVDDIRTMYRELGPEIFRKRFWPARLRSLYKNKALTARLMDFYGEKITIGAAELRTLLLIVLHRIDSDSLWPLSNNTQARYNDRTRRDCNLNFPLWQMVRGSTAAPVYFVPERVPLTKANAFFEDGGVTPFNNPALLLFEMATSPRYRLGWPVGADRLLLVSVGTGFAPSSHAGLTGKKINLLFQGKNLIRVIMNGSSKENDRLCRVLGDCRFGPPLDREFEAAGVDTTPVGTPLFSYVRYNLDISRTGLDAAGFGKVDARRVAKLDAVGAVDDLTHLGAHAAKQVDSAHFAGFETTPGGASVQPPGEVPAPPCPPASPPAEPRTGRPVPAPPP